jgi:hypothetical protein
VNGAADPDRRQSGGPRVPYDLMLICVVAVCFAILIGVSAGLVWLRVFGPA